MKDNPGFVRRVYRKMLYRNLDKVYSKHFEIKQKPRKNKKVLDVGMGFGFDLIRKYRQGYSIYGIDFDKDRVKKTKEMFEKNGMKAVLRVGTATGIPFGKSFFDEVICSHVIEHVKDDRKCLKEIFRVLKKGGKLHLSVPNIKNLHTSFHMKIGSEMPYTDRTHLREYTKDDLLRLLKEENFKIKSVKRLGFIPPFGLKFFMVASHYIPWGSLMEKMGRRFPEKTAEIKVVAIR